MTNARALEIIQTRYNVDGIVTNVIRDENGLVAIFRAAETGEYFQILFHADGRVYAID